MRIRVSPIRTNNGIVADRRPHACFDNAAACRTLLEFWKYNDMGQEDTLPTEVFRKLQSRPFLD